MGDRVGENWWSKFSSAHEWYYVSKLETSEALFFKQWDSHGVVANRVRDQILQMPEGNCEEGKRQKIEDAVPVCDAKQLLSETVVERASRPQTASPTDFCIHGAFDHEETGGEDTLPDRES